MHSSKQRQRRRPLLNTDARRRICSRIQEVKNVLQYENYDGLSTRLPDYQTTITTALFLPPASPSNLLPVSRPGLPSGSASPHLLLSTPRPLDSRVAPQAICAVRVQRDLHLSRFCFIDSFFIWCPICRPRQVNSCQQSTLLPSGKQCHTRPFLQPSVQWQHIGTCQITVTA